MQIDLSKFEKATDEEKRQQDVMSESTTFFKDGVKRLLKNKIATLSLIIIVLITLTSIILPAFWPYSYDQQLGITPGKPVDASYANLAPFEYGKAEQLPKLEGKKMLMMIAPIKKK